MAQEEVKQYVVEGSLYLDRAALSKLPTPVGPFDSREDADLYMWKMKPLYGSWEIVEIIRPELVAELANRKDAANFLKKGEEERAQTSSEV